MIHNDYLTSWDAECRRPCVSSPRRWSNFSFLAPMYQRTTSQATFSTSKTAASRSPGQFGLPLEKASPWPSMAEQLISGTETSRGERMRRWSIYGSKIFSFSEHHHPSHHLHLWHHPSFKFFQSRTFFLRVLSNNI